MNGSYIIFIADTPNKNNRIYPHDVLTKVVADAQKHIIDGRMFGVIGMPSSATINMVNISHKITQMWYSYPDVYVKIDILTTPEGQKLRHNVFNLGLRYTFRPMGLGTLVRNAIGQDVIQPGYELISINAVLETDAS
jgi:hypothetical protein